MQLVELEPRPQAAILTMQHGGACSLSFIAEFNAALDELEKTGALSGLVITGQDKFFSTGFHLEDFFSGGADLRSRMFSGAIRLLARVAALPRATAAAINGHVFGFGALLALACDRRFMRADRGFFCLPELELKVAIPRPMMQLFAMKIRGPLLSDLLLTGRRIGGGEAERLGIVDEACAAGELAARALAWAGALAGRDPETLAAIKRELNLPFLEAAEAWACKESYP